MEDIFQKSKGELSYEKPKPLIFADHHEKNSLVASELVDLGITVEFKHLPVADFLIKETAIERKTCSDFINSMINKRLARQLEEIKQYPKQLLLIEGIDEQEIYTDNENPNSEKSKGIHANAIRGFLLSILLDFQVPIIFTKDYRDTAKFLSILAKKQPKEHFALRAKKKSMNKHEQIQYILEGFQGIGPSTAKKLIEKYKAIKNIINTPIEELKKDIGKKAEIFKLVEEL